MSDDNGAVPIAQEPLVLTKVLNNNVVVAACQGGRERVIMGRGIGFQAKVGDTVHDARIEKTYMLESGTSIAQLQDFLANLPYEVGEKLTGAVTSAVAAAEESLGRNLGKSLPFAVLDHMSFVLERMSQNVKLPVAAMPELSVLYPEEFAAANAMKRVLEDKLDRALPRDEAVYLAMHVLNATRDEYNQIAGLLFRRVQHIVSLVQAFFGYPLDDTTLDYARFVLHVKFFLQRLTNHTQLEKAEESFFEFARHNYPRSYECAKQVKAYVEAETAISPTTEEMLYLIVHIERVIRKTETGK